MLKKFLSLIIIAIAVALSIVDPFPVASDLDTGEPDMWLVDTNESVSVGPLPLDW